jgi:hypothetical protein
MALRCDGCRETGTRNDPLFKVVEIDHRPDSQLAGIPQLIDLHQKCIAVRLINRPGRAYMRVQPKPPEVKV